MSSSLFLVSLLLTLVARPLQAKTFDLKEDKTQSLSSLLENFLPQVSEVIQNEASLTDMLGGLFGSKMDEDTLQGLGNIKSLLTKKLLKIESLKALVSEKIMIDKNRLKSLLEVANKVKILSKEQDDSIMTTLESIFDNMIIQSEQYELQNRKEADSNTFSSFQNKLLEVAKKIFDGKLSNLNSTLVSTVLQIPTEMTDLNSTYSTIWMIVKSTWQRILAYVEDENSLETFMQFTPFKVIDNIISLGDDLNLMNFLAMKLDKDFSEFLASEINPYLGPLKDFQSFYNFTKENGFNCVIDYFISDKFTYTINVMSKLISAYLENTVSDDLVNQYIEFISFNNTELHNFYKSVLKSQGTTITPGSDPNTASANATKRFKRDVLENIASSYIINPSSEQNTNAETRTISPRQFQQRFGATKNLGLSNSIYDPSRDGGYGGGGYGHSGGYGGGGYSMNTLDPYVILGSLALGTILGFLLFRALRGTGNGRRDIGDGSLSLWNSDLPDKILPWGSSVERLKRQVQDDTQGFSLPLSLRGDVWSSDPLVADNFLDDHLNEDDIAHHLNHLWRLYRENNETACVHSHLCDVMANSTAHHLTSKDSSLALLMASVGNLLGVAGSGQLVDDVTSSLVVGNSYTCPNLATCHPM